jgi:hypothetical protein
VGSVSSKNPPVPEVVQRIEDADPPKEPSVACVEPSQIVAAPPDATVAIALMVSTIVENVDPQGPPGSSVVIVNVTEPAVISAAEGVYTVVGSVFNKNPPVPEVVQRIEVAPPPKVPSVACVEPEQMVAAAPAEAVAAGSIVSSIASDTEPQGPAGSSVVMVNVTDPAVISAADGV